MNCLKCGRTVAEGELLCPACSGRGPHPEPEAKAHVNAHQKTHEPVATDSSTAIERLEKRIKRSRRWTLVFLVICVVLLGFSLLQFVALGYLHNQLDQAQSELSNSISTQEDLQERLDTTHELLSTVEEELVQRNMIIEAFEQMTDISADSLP